jgi:hypothetical protein
MILNYNNIFAAMPTVKMDCRLNGKRRSFLEVSLV